MKTSENNTQLYSNVLRLSRGNLLLLILSAVSFIIAALLGLATSFKVAFPEILMAELPFQVIRPLHIFMSLSAIMSGMLALTNQLSVQREQQSVSKNYYPIIFMFLFVIAGGIGLINGLGNGREYINWPPILSIFLLFALLVSCYHFFVNRKSLSIRSPEGFWLIGAGLLFVLSGLVESHLWLFDMVSNHFVRALSLQWHALDIYFAGNNAVLYGCAIYMLQKEPKKQRGTFLFIIASIGLLFSFGHHHYTSDQPFFLKLLAFIASFLFAQ